MTTSDNHREDYVAKSGLNYTSLFFFEEPYFDDEFVALKYTTINAHWRMTLVYALVYLLVIYAGQAWMRSRAKLDLRRPLIAWNLLLAAYSIAGTVRLWPEFLTAANTKGFVYTMCSSEYAHGVVGCWSWYV